MKTHKTCKVCNLYGTVDLFTKGTRFCITCFKKERKNKAKLYRKNNQKQIKERRSTSYQNNKEKIKQNFIAKIIKSK
jgi:uncharacterized Zn finger protein (UPF0148 family)